MAARFDPFADRAFIDSETRFAYIGEAVETIYTITSQERGAAFAEVAPQSFGPRVWG